MPARIASGSDGQASITADRSDGRVAPEVALRRREGAAEGESWRDEKPDEPCETRRKSLSEADIGGRWQELTGVHPIGFEPITFGSVDRRLLRRSPCPISRLGP